VSAKLKGIYYVAANAFAAIAAQVNPALGKERYRTLALSILAILERHTVFDGSAMPFSEHRQHLAQTACDAVVRMVRQGA
jgi:hypothetical protein